MKAKDRSADGFLPALSRELFGARFTFEGMGGGRKVTGIRGTCLRCGGHITRWNNGMLDSVCGARPCKCQASSWAKGGKK